MPGRLMLRPDALDVEAMGILLAVGATELAEAGTALFIVLELVVKVVLVLKAVLKFVLNVVAVGVVQHVSLVGEIAFVARLEVTVEDILIGVGIALSAVVVIVISV
jgi:hypothetical protein